MNEEKQKELIVIKHISMKDICFDCFFNEYNSCIINKLEESNDETCNHYETD